MDTDNVLLSRLSTLIACAVLFSAGCSRPPGDRSNEKENTRVVSIGERFRPTDSAHVAEVAKQRVILPAAAVSGIVKHAETEERVSSVCIRLLHRPIGDTGAPAYKPFIGYSDTTGSFHIAGLPAGQYLIDACQPDLGLAMVPSPSEPYLSLAENETTNVEIALYPGHTISGIVYERRSGIPIPDAAISQILSDPQSSPGETSATTAADGSFRIRRVFPPPDGKPVRLSVIKAGFKPTERKDKAGDAVSVKLTMADREIVKDFPMERSVRITGTVAASDGVPVPGTRLRIYEKRGILSSTSEALVKQNGSYSADVSPFVSLRLHAVAPGFAPTLSDVVLVKDQPLEKVDVTLERGITLIGSVVGPNDVPVAGASVTAHHHNPTLDFPPAGETIADAAGVFSLYNQPFGVRLQATFADYAPSDILAIEPNAQNPRTGIILKLSRGLSIGGTVRDETGRPATNVEVIAGVPSGEARSTITDAYGRYRISNLHPIRYSLYAKSETDTEKRYAQIQSVDAGREDVDLVLELQGSLTEDATLIGTVVDDQTNAIIRTFEYNDERVSMLAPGQFIRPFMHPRVHHTFIIRAPGYAPVEFEVIAPQAGKIFEQEFRLRRGTTISGRVLDRDTSRPLAGVKVQGWGALSYFAQLQEQTPVSVALTDDQGRFTLQQISTGHNMIRFVPDPPLGPLDKQVHVKEEKPIDVGDILIGLSGGLRIRVVKGEAKEPVSNTSLQLAFSSDFDKFRTHRTNASGECLLADLPEGNYWITENSSNAGAAAKVVAGRISEIEMHVGGCTLAGTAIFNGKPLLVNGRIYAVDRSKGTTREVTGSPNGRIRITDLAPGTYRLLLREMRNPRIIYCEAIHIREADTFLEKEFVLRDASLVGRVVNQAGEAVVQASVELIRNTTKQNDGEHFAGGTLIQEILTDDSGTFLFSGIPVGPYVLRAHKAGAGASKLIRLNLSEGNWVDMKMTLEPGESTTSTLLHVGYSGY